MNPVRIYVFVALTLVGCSTNEDKGKVLARVNDTELHQRDIEFLFRDAKYSVEDSTERAEQYIEEWVNEQALVQTAKKSADIDMDAIDKKAERFKNEMIIHQLIEQEVEDKLDTIVPIGEIRLYYKEHQQEFQLNDYLVKVLYMKVPFDAPDIEKISSAYKLRNASDIQDLEIYAPIYASNFYYDEENWIYFDDLLKEIPLQDINKDRFIVKRSKIKFEEAGYYYFLNIIDYKLKNTLSPLEFEKENIRERIINLRVNKLRQEIKDDIIKKAHEEGAITVYQ